MRIVKWWIQDYNCICVIYNMSVVCDIFLSYIIYLSIHKGEREGSKRWKEQGGGGSYVEGDNWWQGGAGVFWYGRGRGEGYREIII